MYVYQDYGSEELVGILSKKNNLTYLSKIELKKELERRKLGKDLHVLQEEIDVETSKILNLEYLPNIGFDITWITKDSFEITRTFKAKLIDILAIIIGILLMLAGVKGIMNFVQLNAEGGFHILPIIINFLLISIGITGFNMLYKGANRLMEFKDFKLVVHDRMVRLFKRFDFELIDTEAYTSDLTLEKEGEELILKLRDMEVFKGNANSYRQEMTIKELIHKIRK